MHSSSGFLENKQRREYRSGHRMPPLILPLNCRSGPEKSSVGRPPAPAAWMAALNWQGREGVASACMRIGKILSPFGDSLHSARE